MPSDAPGQAVCPSVCLSYVHSPWPLLFISPGSGAFGLEYMVLFQSPGSFLMLRCESLHFISKAIIGTAQAITYGGLWNE